VNRILTFPDSRPVESKGRMQLKMEKLANEFQQQGEISSLSRRDAETLKSISEVNQCEAENRADGQTL
jgi:hypothetical protein